MTNNAHRYDIDEHGYLRMLLPGGGVASFEAMACYLMYDILQELKQARLEKEIDQHGHRHPK